MFSIQFFFEKMSELLISSFLVSVVSESLKSLTKNERFAHVAQRKWAILSESLRSLTKNEQMSESLIFLSKSLIHSFLGKKRAIRSEKRMSKFPALQESKWKWGHLPFPLSPYFLYDYQRFHIANLEILMWLVTMNVFGE